MANLNMCVVWPCGLCVLILGLLADFRSYVGTILPLSSGQASAQMLCSNEDFRI